jgi:hypothetical protein
MGSFDSSLLNFDENMFQMAHCQHQIVYVVVIVGTNILGFFNTNELN